MAEETLGNLIAQALTNAFNNFTDNLSFGRTDTAERNKRYRKALEEQEGNKENNKITETNSVVYTTQSAGYKAFLDALDKSAVPALAFSNNQDYTVIVTVPKQYEARADDISKKLNVAIKETEIPYKDFSEKHLGDSAIEHKHLTELEVAYIRKELRGSGHEFAVRKNREDDNSVLCTTKQAKAINGVVLEARAKARDKAFEKEMDGLRNRMYICDTIKKNARNVNETTVIRNASTEGKPVYYMLNAKGLYEVAENKKMLIASQGTPDIAQTLIAKTDNMRAPMVRVFNNKDMNYDEDLFEKKAVAAANERAASECVYKGDAEQARLYVAQILALNASVKYNDKMDYLINDINNSINLSAVLADEHADKSDVVRYEELNKELEELDLSKEQKAELADYAKGVLSEYNYNADFDKVMTANDLTLKDLEKAIDAEMEVEKENREREMEKDREQEFER